MTERGRKCHKWVPLGLVCAGGVLASSCEFKEVRVTRTDCTKAMLADARQTKRGQWQRETGCPRAVPTGGVIGACCDSAGATSLDRRHHSAANAEPQWRRVVRHHGDHGDLRAGGHGAKFAGGADGRWRGAVWSWAPKGQCHRAQGICMGVGDRRARWSGVRARTAAGPCPFVSCLNQLQICLNRARPVELRLARWLDMGGGMQRGP